MAPRASLTAMNGVRLVSPCGMPWVVCRPWAARTFSVVSSVMTPTLGRWAGDRLEDSRQDAKGWRGVRGLARGALPRTHAEFPPGLAAGTGGRVGAVVLDPTVAPRPRPGLAAGGHRLPGLQPRGRVGPGRVGRAHHPALLSRPDRPRLGGRCAAAPRRRTTPRRGPGRDSRLLPESGSAGPAHRGHRGDDLSRCGRRAAVAGGRRVRALARGEPA